jgi:hypothetical protein
VREPGPKHRCWSLVRRQQQSICAHVRRRSSRVIDPSATALASISSNNSFTGHPILYYSINATSFDSSVTYDSGAQESWAVLQQINDGVPEHTPRQAGTLVLFHEISASWLKNASAKQIVADYP